MEVKTIEVEPAPRGFEEYHQTLLTPDALKFVAQLVATHDQEVDYVLRKRFERKNHLDDTNSLPDFPTSTSNIRNGNWKVAPLPERLKCRYLDLGDVSPSNTEHFVLALKSTAQGIQTDFDDGHCPTWSNQLLGLHNVYRAVHGKISGVRDLSSIPVLMLRPRAWNMYEHNMLVNGKEVPGPLFDFGILMYHCGKRLQSTGCGPFFYLSKVESFLEARLWNKVFIWTQNKLGIPLGSIKACVLIENILASFEMEEILFELKDHSAGLNCGLWDYSASFVNKFGHRAEFVLPDRNKYVNMERHFLKSYMDLVIKTCHNRCALATGGMAAQLLPEDTNSAAYKNVVDSVCRAKLKEIKAGADGFMVYDAGLLQPTQDLFKKHTSSLNQIHIKRPEVNIKAEDLLQMPSGGVTLQGLKHNIGVGIYFIRGWLQGKGHYFYKGAVEDSATAEISRSQVWQWLRHGAKLEDNGEKITRGMIQQLIAEIVQDSFTSESAQYSTDRSRRQLITAAAMFEEIITKRSFPEFITTYLSLDHTFLNEHSILDAKL